jgi:hypothetical protein
MVGSFWKRVTPAYSNWGLFLVLLLLLVCMAWSEEGFFWTFVRALQALFCCACFCFCFSVFVCLVLGVEGWVGGVARFYRDSARLVGCCWGGRETMETRETVETWKTRETKGDKGDNAEYQF